MGRNIFSSRSDDCEKPVKVHDHELCELLIHVLASLQRIEGIVMTTSAEFTAAFERLNVATSQIATVLAGISANIGNMSADEETAAKAQLDAAVASLEAMATNAANPVPVEPPVTP